MNIANKKLAYGVTGAGTAISLAAGGIAAGIGHKDISKDRKDTIKASTDLYNDEKKDLDLKIGLITAAGVVASGATGLGISHFVK